MVMADMIRRRTILLIHSMADSLYGRCQQGSIFRLKLPPSQLLVGIHALVGFNQELFGIVRIVGEIGRSHAGRENATGTYLSGAFRRCLIYAPANLLHSFATHTR